VSFLINRRQITIDWGHCDPAGLVLSSRVFEYFDTSSWALFQAALGVRPSDIAATFDIMGIPLVDARARVNIPLRFGDAIEVLSNIGAFRRSSFNIEHRLLRDGAIAVEGSETRVWAAVDKDDPAKLKARPIPAAVMERFKTG
jgi:4-hydroxybenzoyl-CoA thioesterase